MAEKPEAVAGLVRAVNRATLEVMADPSIAAEAIRAYDQRAHVDLEMKRLDFVLDNLMNAPALRRAGVTLGVGTDASNTSDGQNMFEALRLAATLSRARAEPQDWISALAAFGMATEGSARLLGFERVGRIEAGWAADLVFLDRAYCHYTPLRAPLEQMVFSETGAAVREVMIAGAWVFRDDRVLTLDEPALARAAEQAAARLDSLNEPARRTAAAATAVIRGFCLGQCRADAARNRETTP